MDSSHRWVTAKLDIDLTCCETPDVERVVESQHTAMFYVQCNNCRVAARVVRRAGVGHLTPTREIHKEETTDELPRDALHTSRL